MAIALTHFNRNVWQSSMLPMPEPFAKSLSYFYASVQPHLQKRFISSLLTRYAEDASATTSLRHPLGRAQKQLEHSSEHLQRPQLLDVCHQRTVCQSLNFNPVFSQYWSAHEVTSFHQYCFTANAHKSLPAKNPANWLHHCTLPPYIPILLQRTTQALNRPQPKQAS